MVHAPIGDAKNERISFSILRRFDFLSELQRMSVIAKNENNGDRYVFVKGSPEKIQQLCKPETMPTDYISVVHHYAHQGYRIIACAYKKYEFSDDVIDTVKRESMECELNFLGLVVMENKMKPDSADVIAELKEARIRSIMVTGDNPLTAISVARQCGIVGAKQQVFFGTMNNNEVEWKDYDSDETLDPTTLLVCCKQRH